MPAVPPRSLAGRGKKVASAIANSKIGQSVGAYASAKPKRAAAMGYMGAAGLGAMMKKRGPGTTPLRKMAQGGLRPGKRNL